MDVSVLLWGERSVWFLAPAVDSLTFFLLLPPSSTSKISTENESKSGLDQWYPSGRSCLLNFEDFFEISAQFKLTWSASTNEKNVYFIMIASFLLLVFFLIQPTQTQIPPGVAGSYSPKPTEIWIHPLYQRSSWCLLQTPRSPPNDEKAEKMGSNPQYSLAPSGV